MPGTITIQTQPGCDADEVIMTLSSTAEPNGGDHFATVDFTGQSQNRMLVGLLSVELETAPGVWIGVTVQSFHFTSAGEEYKLRARGNEILMNWPNIKFPYTVVAVYAPAWAALDGVITGDPIDEECCVPTGESTNNQLFWTGFFGTAAYNTQTSACDGYVSGPATWYASCSTASDNSYIDVTPSVTIYDWYAKEFSVGTTISFSATVEGVAGTVSGSFTFTKEKDSNTMRMSFSYTASISGTLNDGAVLPAQNNGTNEEIYVDMPCTAYKILVPAYGKSVRVGYAGGGRIAAAEIGYIPVQFVRPT